MAIINLDRLLSKLDKVENMDVKERLEKACLLVENTAKQDCPVDTGQLRASITHEVDGNVGVVGTNVEYAVYVEYGTGKEAVAKNGRQTPWSYKDEETGEWIWTKGQKPQPFLEPALIKNEKEINKLFLKAIKEGLKGNV